MGERCGTVSSVHLKSSLHPRRWRLTCLSGVNSFIIDGRVRFKTVDLGDSNGEHLYSITGHFVKDATLAGRAKFTLANAVATIP